MKNKGITPKFTLIELRDNITEYNCGHRGQSCKFNQLDRNLKCSGAKVSLKVPVIHLHIFQEEEQRTLISAIMHRHHAPPQCTVTVTTMSMNDTVSVTITMHQ